jgi:hypothetical protein
MDIRAIPFVLSTHPSLVSFSADSLSSFSLVSIRWAARFRSISSPGCLDEIQKTTMAAKIARNTIPPRKVRTPLGVRVGFAAADVAIEVS